MSVSSIENLKTKVAGADLRTKQYYIVKISTTDTIDVADSAAVAWGVLQDKPNTAEQGRVAPCGSGGESFCVSDGSGTVIAIGDRVKSHTNGKAIKAANDKDYAIGVATSASSADGTIIGVDLNKAGFMGV